MLIEFINRAEPPLTGEGSEVHNQGSADGEADVTLHQSVDSSCGAEVIISHLLHH